MVTVVGRRGGFFQPGQLDFGDGEKLEFGTQDDFSLHWDDGNQRFVLRDEQTGEDRLYLAPGAAMQLVSQGLDLNALDVVNGADGVYDADAGEVTADVNNEKTTTEDTVTETLDYSHGGAAPTSPHMPTMATGPANLQPWPGIQNPIYTGSDVTDLSDVDFAPADHFIVRKDDTFYMLAEVAHDDDGDTDQETSISLWSGPDPINMDYQRNVMDDSTTESEALSYPFFLYDEAAGKWYCCPNHGGAGNTNGIYEATTWPPTGPGDWSLVETATRWGGDNAIWRFNGVWYAIKGGTMYYNEDATLISSNWQTHPDSPPSGTPAGRPMVYPDSVFFPVKYNPGNDGDRALRFHKFTELTTSSSTSVIHKPDPILGGTGPAVTGNWWYSKEVHHIDVAPTQFGPTVYLVDGRQATSQTWAVGAFVEGPHPRMLARVDVASNQTIGDGSTLNPVPLSRDLDYYNLINTTDDDINIPERGIYNITWFLDVDPVDTISTPYNFALRLWDGSTNVWGTETVQFPTSNLDSKTVHDTARLPAGDVTPIVKNNGDQNVDLLSASYIIIERSPTA